MIGQNVYYVDFKQDKVLSALCTGASVSSQGYLLYELQTALGLCHRERAFVFRAQETALKAYHQMHKIYMKMQQVQQQCQETLNQQRLLLLGEPDFPNWAMRKGEENAEET